MIKSGRDTNVSAFDHLSVVYRGASSRLHGGSQVNMVSRVWAAPFEARHNVAVLLRQKVAAHDVPPILTRPLTSEVEPKFANTVTRDWAVEGRFFGDTSVTRLELKPVQSASRPNTTRTLQ
jgi:hypothetical protein